MNNPEIEKVYEVLGNNRPSISWKPHTQAIKRKLSKTTCLLTHM